MVSCPLLSAATLVMAIFVPTYHGYFIGGTTSGSVHEADLICQSHGSSLASIYSMLQNEQAIAACNASTLPRDCWIGLYTNFDNHGPFTWFENDIQSNFYAFDEGNPDNLHDDCVVIDVEAFWNDVSCGNEDNIERHVLCNDHTVDTEQKLLSSLQSVDGDPNYYIISMGGQQLSYDDADALNTIYSFLSVHSTTESVQLWWTDGDDTDMRSVRWQFEFVRSAPDDNPMGDVYHIRCMQTQLYLYATHDGTVGTSINASGIATEWILSPYNYGQYFELVSSAGFGLLGIVDTHVSLFSFDDGSGRQRWIIEEQYRASTVFPALDAVEDSNDDSWSYSLQLDLSTIMVIFCLFTLTSGCCSFAIWKLYKKANSKQANEIEEREGKAPGYAQGERDILHLVDEQAGNEGGNNGKKQIMMHQHLAHLAELRNKLQFKSRQKVHVQHEHAAVAVQVEEQEEELSDDDSDDAMYVNPANGHGNVITTPRTAFIA